MRKISKLFFVFLMVFSLLFVTSCDKKDNEVDTVEELEEVMEELENKSATINCDMTMSMTMKINDQVETQTVDMEMYIESDSTKSYTIATMEGEKQYVYTVVEGEYVKEYAKVDDAWQLADTVKKEDFSSNSDLFDIDVEDAFTLVDGVWVGNCELLSDVLSETMEEMAADLGGIGGISFDETKINKYNITISEGQVSVVDIEMYIKMSASNVVIEVTIAMPMNISKLGETVVTVPEDLPIE